MVRPDSFVERSIGSPDLFRKYQSMQVVIFILQNSAWNSLKSPEDRSAEHIRPSKIYVFDGPEYNATENTCTQTALCSF
jgi:hypothetical protein